MSPYGLSLQRKLLSSTNVNKLAFWYSAAVSSTDKNYDDQIILSFAIEAKSTREMYLEASGHLICQLLIFAWRAVHGLETMRVEL